MKSNRIEKRKWNAPLSALCSRLCVYERFDDVFQGPLTIYYSRTTRIRSSQRIRDSLVLRCLSLSQAQILPQRVRLVDCGSQHRGQLGGRGVGGVGRLGRRRLCIRRRRCRHRRRL